MRTYVYIRVNPFEVKKLEIYLSSFKERGYTIQKNRLVLEEVEATKPVLIRDKLLNLINHSLEAGDLLIVNSIDCLGGKFKEIFYIINKIFEKKIRVICFDFSKNEIDGDLKVFFLHFLKVCMNFEGEILYKPEKETRNIGRPESLSLKQKNEVIDMYKNGSTIYSIARSFSVSRCVIQRVIKMHKIYHDS